MQVASPISSLTQLISPAMLAKASRGSPLNPVTSVHALHKTRPASQRISNSLTENVTIESSRTHLSNLERLLQVEKEAFDLSPNRPQIDPGGGKPPETTGRGFLDGLNLAGLWQGTRTEMTSPGTLRKLRRLLSKGPEYSPRNNLGNKWREYHGSKDWAGLLDPLDENLRREIVRYGEFIQAAYNSFHNNPATPCHPTTPLRVGLQDRSYRATKSLYATSSVGLPKWVDDMGPELSWITQRSSWIGYVAVCEDEKEIRRMGRRDIMIAFRGTATCLEWVENMRDVLVRIPEDEALGSGSSSGSGSRHPKVECGFWSLYKTQGLHVPSLSKALVDEVRRLMDMYKGERLSITITGHSLGAAMALLAADELSTCSPDMPPIAVFSFGGPRVGNRAFAKRVEGKGIKVLRVVNTQDVITRVPGVLVNEELDQKLRDTNADGMLSVLDNMPWAYSHVGRELRVDSKMSPYLKPNADVACCHDLEAYLHLVDGFSGTNSSFRPNAKRSILRLLNEQRSNVKRLYMSKSMQLNLDNVAPIPSCLASPS